MGTSGEEARMGERPGGVSALMWALIVMGLLGLLGNSLSAASSAASGAMFDLAAQSQDAALDELDELEGAQGETVRDLVAGQQAMMEEVAAVTRRTRPVTLAMGVLGMLVSGLLVFGAFRGLKGGEGDVVLRRALWAAGLWSVASFAVSSWMQRLQAAATGEQMERMMDLAAGAAEAGPDGAALPDFSGLQEGILAVTLAFGALVVIAKLLLYGYGLWYSRQPEARAWLLDGIGVGTEDEGLAQAFEG
jgi:hypothetical protein